MKDSIATDDRVGSPPGSLEMHDRCNTVTALARNVCGPILSLGLKATIQKRSTMRAELCARVYRL